MGKLVEPKVYYLGCTKIDMDGMLTYLRDSGCEAFAQDIEAARKQGVSDPEILSSFYGKLCYRSLVPGQNANIGQVRDIPGNFRGLLQQVHKSVLEHAQLNFVVRNASRVFECELIRHRVGTAFSIESGRYFRSDRGFDLVYDNLLDPVKNDLVYLHTRTESIYQGMVAKLGLDQEKDKDRKKQLTSALRRILPEGKAKEIGFSLNLAALRHTVQMRTSRHAEREIRFVFAQVYELVKARHPLVFSDAQEEIVDGITEVRGMRLEPYEPEDL